jgi:hypothetical protein
VAAAAGVYLADLPWSLRREAPDDA